MLAYYVGGPVGRWLTRLVASSIGAPPESAAAADPSMNWEYPSVLAGVAASALGFARPPPPRLPRQPTLYMYAADKPVQFHSRAWLEAFSGRTDGAWRPPAAAEASGGLEARDVLHLLSSRVACQAAVQICCAALKRAAVVWRILWILRRK